MQKADIARHIRQHVGISKTEATKAQKCVLELLKTTRQEGEPIAISGFGKFTVRQKPECKHDGSYNCGPELIFDMSLSKDSIILIGMGGGGQPSLCSTSTPAQRHRHATDRSGPTSAHVPALEIPQDAYTAPRPHH